MSFSVNTNGGALIALENLNQTSQQLQQAQNIVSTGEAVSTAKDNGAVWAIAQGERSTVASLDAVKSSLQTGQSIIDVANSAGTTVSNLLTQMEQKALAASDTSLDTNSRAALNNDFVALRNQIQDALDCMKQDGTISKLSEKWFGAKPAPDDLENTITPGYGVPDMPGYDPTPHPLHCQG